MIVKYDRTKSLEEIDNSLGGIGWPRKSPPRLVPFPVSHLVRVKYYY